MHGRQSDYLITVKVVLVYQKALLLDLCQKSNFLLFYFYLGMLVFYEFLVRALVIHLSSPFIGSCGKNKDGDGDQM